MLAGRPIRTCLQPVSQLLIVRTAIFESRNVVDNLHQAHCALRFSDEEIAWRQKMAFYSVTSENRIAWHQKIAWRETT